MATSGTENMTTEDANLSSTNDNNDLTTENIQEQSEQLQEEVLPFVNFQVITPAGKTIPLNLISLMENVSYLKQHLSEYFETCEYTHYVFEFRPAEQDSFVLSDFAELNAYFADYIGKTVTLHMISQSYDGKTARAHVKRVRDILSYPPQVKGLPPIQATHAPEEENKESQEKEQSLEEMKANIERVKAALPTDGDIFTAQSVSLKDYYQEVLYRVSENPDTIVHHSITPADSIKGMFFSGWNPPPPPRKLRGDLFYLEVHFNVPNAPALHITAQSNGFYINKSTTAVFDPTPAVNANFSHDLLETLIASSPAISHAWNALSKKIDEQMAKAGHIDEDIATSKANALGSVAALYAQGRGDLVAQVPEWTSRPIEGNRKTKNLSYDMSRAQDDLCDSFGVEEKGALREWNEEIQTIRQLSTKDISEYLMKARYSQRITQEFTEACKIAVVAICNGHIVSVNPMDDLSNQVYMYNNIFFSRPVDVRETFKVTQGDEACRKAAGHDLKNQKILQALNIEGLHTVLTAIVDYRGQRWIGQSVIPGILQASENSARLMYGILEDGARMKCKTPAYNIMKEIGTRLAIAERNVPASPTPLVVSPSTSKAESQNALLGFLACGDSQSQIIRVDDLDEVADSDSTSIPHVGPLEGKILRGSDGRLYALEMTRLTPRDANFIKTNGTGKISEENFAHIDENVCMTYVLRQELIQSYKQTRTLQMRQAEMVKEYEKFTEESKLEEEKKKNLENGSPTTGSQSESQESQPNLESEITQNYQKIFSPEVMKKLSTIQMEFSVNPNVFLHTPCDVDEKVIQADEQIAKDFATFLWDIVLPHITELVRLGEEAPYDGKTLTQFLHRRGVNMRYLGELSRLARDEEEIDRKTQLENQKRKNPMPVFWQDLIEVEIIARCMKHLVNSFISDNSLKIPAPLIISHLLNLLMGNGEISPEIDLEELLQNESKKSVDQKKKKNTKKGHSKSTPAIVSPTVPGGETFNMTKDEFWKAYTTLAKSKFLHFHSALVTENPENSRAARGGNPFTFSRRLSKLSILRRICQICGIRVQCKDYDWSVPSPFSESDIYDVVPLVKTCEPDAPVPEVRLLLEEAKILLQQSSWSAAYERAQDASKYISQVTGPVHQDTSRALSYMYSVLHSIGDIRSALSTLSKKLTIDVQLHGLDSAETLQNHLNMSVVYQEVGNYLAAASHIRSAVYILRLLCGDQHPEISNIYYRLSTIYDEVGNTELALRCLKIAKELIYWNGDQGTHALICQNMAALYAQLDNFKEAIALQKECYSILRQLFGEADSKTADAKVRFEILIRKSAERNEQKAEREKKDKESSESLWLEDVGTKNSKKSTNKGKKGKKK